MEGIHSTQRKTTAFLLSAAGLAAVMLWAALTGAASAQDSDLQAPATLGEILAAADEQDGTNGFDADAFNTALNEHVKHHTGDKPTNGDSVPRDAVNYALGKANGIDLDVDGGDENWETMRDEGMSFGRTQGEDDWDADDPTTIGQIFAPDINWLNRCPRSRCNRVNTPGRWRPPTPRVAVAGIAAGNVYEDGGNARLIVSLTRPATTRVTFTVSYRQAAAVGHRGARCQPQYWPPYGAAACGPSTNPNHATEGTDYRVGARSGSIGVGSRYAIISIPIIDDAIDERNESVSVSVSNFTGVTVDCRGINDRTPFTVVGGACRPSERLTYRQRQPAGVGSLVVSTAV